MESSASNIGVNSTAILDVNVIPMDSERILEHYSVLIRDGRVIEMGPVDQIHIPDDAFILQAGGAYMIPGIANMHTHLIEFDPDPRHLILYLAHGVTVLRSLNSPWETLNWRQKVNSGDWLGPRIFLSGPAIVGVHPIARTLVFGLRILLGMLVVLMSALLFGIIWYAVRWISGPDAGRLFAAYAAVPWLAISVLLAAMLNWWKILPITRLVALVYPQASVVETPSQARKEVRRQVEAGVDFIKSYGYLRREVYFAAIAATEELGVYAAGHLPGQPDLIRLEEALSAGQDEIVHMDELTPEFWTDYNPSKSGKLDFEIDLERIDDIAETLSIHHAAITATLVPDEAVILGLEDIDDLLTRPEFKLIRPETIQKWRTQGRFVNWRGQEKYRREEWRPLLMNLTKALQEKGIPILLGTDVSVEGIIPGASEHWELQLLVEAGLTPFEALCCGTRNAALVAERMGVDSHWGTIQVGNRADFILLHANPLENIANTEFRMGVMLTGEWYPQDKLDLLVGEFITTYKK